MSIHNSIISNLYKNLKSDSHKKSTNKPFGNYIKFYSKPKISEHNKFANGLILFAEMKGGYRKDSNVIKRTAITLDIDDSESAEHIVQTCEDNFDFSYILHSTYSHTDENKRFRLIVPLDKSIDPNVYKGALKWFSNALGIENDPNAEAVSQAMGLPCIKSGDSPYIFEYKDTFLFKVDKVIDDWQIAASDDYFNSLGDDYTKRDDEHWEIAYGGITEGEGRNSALASLTGHLARYNINITVMIALLSHWNDSNLPPLSEAEFNRTIKSILKKENNRRQGGD